MYRCYNQSNNLDGDDNPHKRSRVYTEALCRSFVTTVLWDDWGIVDQVVVCRCVYRSFQPHMSFAHVMLP